MKYFQKAVKTNFKFLTLFLALLICTKLFIVIISENTNKNLIKIQKIENNSNENLNEDNIKSNHCTEFDKEQFLMKFMKCCIAFIFGALISERKFIFLGKI